MGELISRAQLAKQLGRSERTLRRYLPTVPGLSCVKIGRSVYFSEQDVLLIQETLRCPYPTAKGEKSGTSVARSVSDVNLSRSKSTARDALLARMRKQLDQQKRRASEKENCKDLKRP